MNIYNTNIGLVKISGIDGYYCKGYLEENNILGDIEESFEYFIAYLKKVKLWSKSSTHKLNIETFVGY